MVCHAVSNTLYLNYDADGIELEWEFGDRLFKTDIRTFHCIHGELALARRYSGLWIMRSHLTIYPPSDRDR